MAVIVVVPSGDGEDTIEYRIVDAVGEADVCGGTSLIGDVQPGIDREDRLAVLEPHRDEGIEVGVPLLNPDVVAVDPPHAIQNRCGILGDGIADPGSTGTLGSTKTPGGGWYSSNWVFWTP